MLKLSENEINELEAHWDGTLEDSRRQALLERIDQDAEFRKAAQLWKHTISQGFRPAPEEITAAQNIKKGLQEIESQMGSSPQKEFNYRYWLPAIAAGILLLLWLVPWQTWFSTSNEFQAFFEVPTRYAANLGDERSPGEKAYDEGRYTAAQALLRTEAQELGDSLLLFYAGIAAMSNGDVAQAIPDLEAALAAQDLEFYHTDIQWYLALAYGQEGEIDYSKDLLMELQGSSNKFHEKVNILLKKINSNVYQ